MKRPAQLGEIARTYVLLASPQMSNFITGETLLVIGGPTRTVDAGSPAYGIAASACAPPTTSPLGQHQKFAWRGTASASREW